LLFCEQQNVAIGQWRFPRAFGPGQKAIKSQWATLKMSMRAQHFLQLIYLLHWGRRTRGALARSVSSGAPIPAEFFFPAKTLSHSLGERKLQLLCQALKLQRKNDAKATKRKKRQLRGAKWGRGVAFSSALRAVISCVACCVRGSV